MQDILRNLASIHLLAYCKENGVDPSGTHTEKKGRGFTYALVDSSNGDYIIHLTFTKYSTPRFVHYPAIADRIIKWNKEGTA